MLINERAKQLNTKWTTGQSDIYDDLHYQPRELIRRAFYMLNFSHLNGEKDDKSKLKPYMDIYQRIMDTQQAGENLDTKDFDFEAISPKYITQSFLIEKEHQEWMREINFGQIVDEFTAIRGIFGHAWIKPIRADGNLDFEITDWAIVSPDPDDFEGDKLYEYEYNKNQILKNKGWMKDKVDLLMGMDQSIFEVREWYGVASLAEFKDFKGEEVMDGDSLKFDEYVFIYAMVESGDKDKKKKDDRDSVALFGEKTSKTTHYGLKYGQNPRGELGVGSAEKSFQPQQWTNYLTKQEKDTMDLAGKVLIQSPKGNKSKGKNVFTNVKNGTFLEYMDGKPYSKLDLAPSAMAKFDSLHAKWRTINDESNSVYASNTGSDLPSNQTLRGLVLQAEQANNPFSQRRSEMDLFWREVYDEEVIPFLIKRIRNKTEVAGEFSIDELSKIDADVTRHMASKKIIKKLLSGGYDKYPLEERWTLIAEEKQYEMAQVEKTLKKFKSKRFFGGEGFDAMFKDIEKKIRLVITGEQHNKRAMLSNMAEMLQIAGNPQIQQNPQLKHMLDQMMEAVNISPLALPDSLPPQPDVPQISAPELVTGNEATTA